MIGCDKWSDLSKISQSEEMQPWSIRNYYDRPIPRRLLEESNVKRDMFGKEKIGAGISYSYDTIKRIRNKMSSLSYQKLLEFDRNFPKKKWNDIKYIIRFYHINFPIYANYILNRFKIKSIFKCNSEKIGMVSNPISTLLLCWGISEMKKRYKI